MPPKSRSRSKDEGQVSLEENKGNEFWTDDEAEGQAPAGRASRSRSKEKGLNLGQGQDPSPPSRDGVVTQISVPQTSEAVGQDAAQSGSHTDLHSLSQRGQSGSVASLPDLLQRKQNVPPAVDAEQGGGAAAQVALPSRQSVPVRSHAPPAQALPPHGQLEHLLGGAHDGVFQFDIEAFQRFLEFERRQQEQAQHNQQDEQHSSLEQRHGSVLDRNQPLNSAPHVSYRESWMDDRRSTSPGGKHFWLRQ